MQDDNNPAASTAQDIKAAARDMLRLGSRWAHSALDWIDERRHEMNHRNRDDRDFGSDRERGQSSYSASGHDWQERERHGPSGRYPGSRHEQLQGRSDRDIQGDYSGGGYDQVGARDWSRDRDVERQAWAREGRYPQSRTRSPDDDSLRGDYAGETGFGGGSGYGASGGYSGAGYGYGASAPGGVGYGAPGYGAGAGYGESRYQGDFQSRGVGEEEGYGSTGREMGGSRDDQPEYGRGYGRQGAHAQGGRGQEEYGRFERGYGGAGQRESAWGEERQRHDRGQTSQRYGSAGYGEFSGYGGYGERSDQRGQRDVRMQGYRYGSLGEQQGSQSGQLGRSYRGIGPRNYTRSDERIREDLNERLTDAHDIDASQITVEVNNGVATLTGTVGERWMKHRAEDIADGCTGVRDVRNNLQVETRSSESSRRQDTYGSASGQYGSSSQQGTSSQYGSSQQGASSQYGSSQQGTSQYGSSNQQDASSQYSGSTSSGQGGTAGGSTGASSQGSSTGTSSQGSSRGASGQSSGSGASTDSNASSSDSSTQRGGTGRGSSGSSTTGPSV